MDERVKKYSVLVVGIVVALLIAHISLFFLRVPTGHGDGMKWNTDLLQELCGVDSVEEWNKTECPEGQQAYVPHTIPIYSYIVPPIFAYIAAVLGYILIWYYYFFYRD